MIVREDLKAFVDGELSPELMKTWEDAIANDPALAEEVRFCRLLFGETKALAVEPVAVAAEKTLDALRRPTGLADRLGRNKWAVAGLATFSILAAVVMFPLTSSAGISARNKSDQTAMFRNGATGSSAKSATADVAKQGSTYGFAGGGGSRERNEASIETAPRANTDDVRAFARRAPLEGLAESRVQGRQILGQLNGKTVSSTSDAHNYMRPKLRRSSDISVGVKSAQDSQEDLQKTVVSWGGFVMNSSMNSTETETSVLLTIKTPEVKYDETLRYIRKLGKVLSENSQSEDVTAEVVDSRTRVEILADEEANLVARLNKSRNANEKLNLRYEIRQVRQELASWKAQDKALTEQTEYSQITVSIVQKDEGTFSESWSDDSWNQASSGLGALGKVLGRMGIFAVVYLPVWAPLVLIGWLLARKRA